MSSDMKLWWAHTKHILLLLQEVNRETLQVLPLQAMLYYVLDS